MNTKRFFIIGTAVGTTIGTINLLIIYLAKGLFANGSAALSLSLLATILVGGTLLGAGSSLLCLVTAGKEKTILMILFSIALAALIVLLGQYGNESLVPIVIYALMVSNGLLICRMSTGLFRSIETMPSFHTG